MDTETAQSESYRARMLAVVFLAATVLFSSVTGLLPDDMLYIFGNPGFRYPIALIMLLVAVYESAVSLVFGSLGRSGKKLPIFARVGNTTAEISIPTVGIILMSTIVHPVHALLSPFVALYFIFIILSVLRLSFGLSLYSGLLAGAEYFVLVLYVLSSSDTSAVDPLLASPMFYISRAVLLVVAGISAAVITKGLRMRIARLLKTAEEKQQVIQLFGQQVSEPVVAELLRHPDHAGGVLRRVTVLFLDIRDFTPMVGSRKPEEVVAFLNTMFGTLIPIVEKQGGIVNQFLGDGFMATFGAPVPDERHAAHAVEAALGMQSAVERMSRDGVIPMTRIGIGVHTGEAVTGNIGAGARKQYSVTGNAVILASRIEQLNKVYKTSVLISGNTWSEIDHRALFTESLGTVILKGCSDPVVIYKLA